jgi:hypothetical protein
MNFYGTGTTEQHSLSGRLIPLMEAMYLSIRKASGQPAGEPRYSMVLPPWAHKLCDKFTVTICKNLVAMAPKDNQFIARHYGQMIGMLLRGVVFSFNELPARLKNEGLCNLTEEQANKLEKLSGLPLLFSVASETLQKPISSGDELIQAGVETAEKKTREINEHLFLVLRYLLDRPVQEQYEFLRGIPEGFKAFLNFQGEFVGNKRRFESYLLLAMNWPEIAEMQKAQPPKTRKDLLEWLEKQDGKQLYADPKKFFELCGEIDLDMSPPGHPFRSSST